MRDEIEIRQARHNVDLARLVVPIVKVSPLRVKLAGASFLVGGFGGQTLVAAKHVLRPEWIEGSTNGRITTADDTVMIGFMQVYCFPAEFAPTPTVSFNVHLTRPVTGGTVRATARVVHRSRSLLLADAELFDEQGRQVARGTGSFISSRTPLTADIGYG